jgi:8-oxo-dGTP diphosphatase
MALIVVAAVLCAPDGTILVQQRPIDKAHGGLWEFPGGKREAGESTTIALARELEEELGIGVDPADLAPLGFSVEPRGELELILLLFLCRRWSGVPQPLTATQLRWVDPAHVIDLPLPPADRPLAASLVHWLAGRA